MRSLWLSACCFCRLLLRIAFADCFCRLLFSLCRVAATQLHLHLQAPSLLRLPRLVVAQCCTCTCMSAAALRLVSSAGFRRASRDARHGRVLQGPWRLGWRSPFGDLQLRGLVVAGRAPLAGGSRSAPLLGAQGDDRPGRLPGVLRHRAGARRRRPVAARGRL